MMIDDMKKWIDAEGEIFLRDIGMQRNQSIIDFGCGVGNYTIPAAKVVGRRGKVYAIDKNKESLDELMKRVEEKGIKNIERIDVPEEIRLPLQNESADVILIYDVIHLVDNRKELLAEIYRVSKQNTLISVYPKHHQKDMNMDLDDVKDEIETVGFSFEKKLYKILMHDNYLEKGYVLNFRKQ
ncbi:MAG: class I SAM-dependent methyltransferase [Thermoplasmatales archaeon]|nr:class I SAM-dependent methyltransferase [Thermoplasmatales archaeon]